MFWPSGPSAGWQEWMIKYTVLNGDLDRNSYVTGPLDVHFKQP
jgi:hypothetical protein